jgi:hypothetical protein
MKPARDAALNFPFLKLDRAAYEKAASAEGTSAVTFRSVILENEYLRLTFLPDLGGRLFQITYKPTGQDLLYNNRVLKPTGWGPAQQSGWLAAGGMEWALPVNEHGYEWGIPWQYSVAKNSLAASITLTDSTATDRVRARITVTLPAHTASIMIQPRIENPTSSAARVQFWLNAQIRLGSGTRVSPGTSFILPADSVWIHSTSDRFVPEANIPPDGASSPSAPVPWPAVGGVDLSRYANWQDYLGVFAAGMRQPFAGVFDRDIRLGLVRVFPLQAAPGVKLFGFGQRFCCRAAFADDGSDYVELWGGLPRSFFPSDDVTLGPGETRDWTEYWVPVMGTEGLSAATRDGALYLSVAGGTAQIGAYTTRRQDATVVLFENGSEVGRWQAAIGPGSPFDRTTLVGAGSLQLRLLDSTGNVLCEIK